MLEKIKSISKTLYLFCFYIQIIFELQSNKDVNLAEKAFSSPEDYQNFCKWYLKDIPKEFLDEEANKVAYNAQALCMLLSVYLSGKIKKELNKLKLREAVLTLAKDESLSNNKLLDELRNLSEVWDGLEELKVNFSVGKLQSFLKEKAQAKIKINASQREIAEQFLSNLVICGFTKNILAISDQNSDEKNYSKDKAGSYGVYFDLIGDKNTIPLFFGFVDRGAAVLKFNIFDLNFGDGSSLVPIDLGVGFVFTIAHAKPATFTNLAKKTNKGVFVFAEKLQSFLEDYYKKMGSLKKKVELEITNPENVELIDSHNNEVTENQEVTKIESSPSLLSGYDKLEVEKKTDILASIAVEFELEAEEMTENFSLTEFYSELEENQQEKLLDILKNNGVEAV